MSWDGLRALQRAAAHGTLSAAAAELGVSVATLGRKINALEQTAGLSLLRRLPSGVTLSADGERLLQSLDPAMRLLDQTPRILGHLQSGRLERAVRISSTEPILTDILAPALGKLLAAHPDLRLDFATSNAVADLARGEVDLAIRMVRPVEPNLIARRLPALSLGLYGRFNAAETNRSFCPSLDRLCWYDAEYGAIAENIYLDQQGWASSVVMRASSVRTLLRTAQTSSLIAPLPSFLAEKAGLQPVAAPAMPERTPWLVFHKDAKSDRHLQKVRTWIVDSFKVAVTERGIQT